MHRNGFPPISLYVFTSPSYPSPKRPKVAITTYFFEQKTKKRSGKNIHLQRIVYICRRDK